MPQRDLKQKEWELLRKLRAQLADYFELESGSVNRIMKAIGIDRGMMDKSFRAGTIRVALLAQVLDELGLEFEDLVWDALNFGPPRGKSKIQKRLGIEPERVEPLRGIGIDIEKFLRGGEERWRELKGVEDASEDS